MNLKEIEIPELILCYVTYLCYDVKFSLVKSFQINYMKAHQAYISFTNVSDLKLRDY